MSLAAHERVLLRVTQSKKATLDGFKEGVHLETSTGRPIDDLRDQACADRLSLAEQFLGAGDRLTRARPPLYRVAVGRYYYAMYHAMRAVVFYRTPGDDHEKHSVLPQKTPSDFTQAAYWENELKDARLRRNEADYDPYPGNDGTFRPICQHVKKQAHLLVAECRTYLQSKGCGHV